MAEYEIGTVLTAPSLNGWKKERNLSRFFPNKEAEAQITHEDAATILERSLDEYPFAEKLRRPQAEGFMKYSWPARTGVVFRNEQGVALAIYKNNLNVFEVLRHEL